MIGFVIFLRKYIIRKLLIDGATNLLNWKFQSRYHGKLDLMAKESHIILSTMATARKVMPSNDPVECGDQKIL